MSASVIRLGDAQLSRCPPDLRRTVEIEVEVLALRYAPDGQPETFDAIAEVLETHVAIMGDGRGRVQLWAAAFRRRAAIASGERGPADCPGGRGG